MKIWNLASVFMWMFLAACFPIQAGENISERKDDILAKKKYNQALQKGDKDLAARLQKQFIRRALLKEAEASWRKIV